MSELLVYMVSMIRLIRMNRKENIQICTIIVLSSCVCRGVLASVLNEVINFIFVQEDNNTFVLTYYWNGVFRDLYYSHHQDFGGGNVCYIL